MCEFLMNLRTNSYYFIFGFKWMVCVTEMECVYYEVRTLSLIIIHVKSYIQVVKKFGRISD